MGEFMTHFTEVLEALMTLAFVSGVFIILLVLFTRKPRSRR